MRAAGMGRLAGAQATSAGFGPNRRRSFAPMSVSPRSVGPSRPCVGRIRSSFRQRAKHCQPRCCVSFSARLLGSDRKVSRQEPRSVSGVGADGAGVDVYS